MPSMGNERSGRGQSGLRQIVLADSRLFFVLSLTSQTKIVTCPSNAHLHVLSNLNLEIPLCISRFQLSSIESFESLNESLNAICIFLHLNGDC